MRKSTTLAVGRRHPLCTVGIDSRQSYPYSGSIVGRFSHQFSVRVIDNPTDEPESDTGAVFEVRLLLGVEDVDFALRYSRTVIFDEEHDAVLPKFGVDVYFGRLRSIVMHYSILDEFLNGEMKFGMEFDDRILSG